MNCKYKRTIRPNASLSHVQIACNGTYLVLPCGRTTVGIWSLQDLACKPLELEGHRKAVTALCISWYTNPTLVCSAAEDYVIIWNVEYARASFAAGNQIRGKVIGQTLGAVQYVTFNNDVQLVAVCAHGVVYILQTQEEKLVATLEGHDGTVTCAEFSPHYSATLVTASEDRTFKVWDIENGCLIYQSTIVSSSPFISLVMNPQSQQFALGTSDGQVRVYDLTDGNGFRCLNHIDVEKMVYKIKQEGRQQESASNNTEGPKTISSRPSWQRNTVTSPSTASSDEGSSEAGCAILGMYYKYQSDAERPDSARKLTFLQADDAVVSNLLNVSPVLVIGTTGMILQINTRTLETSNFIDLQDSLLTEDDLEEQKKVISLACSYCFSASRYPEESWCIVTSLFQRVAHVLAIIHPSQKPGDSISEKVEKQLSITDDRPFGYEPSVGSLESRESDQRITVLSSVPLCAQSSLRAELVPKTKEKPPVSRRRSSSSSIASTSSSPGGLDKKGKIADSQPLTFKPQVKSSGYGAESPQSTMFQPQTNFSKTKPQSQWKTTRSSSVDSCKSSVKEYPMNSDPPITLHVKIDADVKPTSVMNCKFSGDGQNLACALANTTAQVFKMPLTGKSTGLLGHNGIVNHVRWSRDNKCLVTSSDDRTACIWSKGQTEPIMVINTVRHNMDVDKEGKPKNTKDNPLFTKELRHAQFYFMDKFILLTSGNTFHLYKYHLDSSKKSDIKRYLTNSRYKLVKTFQMAETQGITAFSAVNSFNSYITLCAGTNKSLEVFDLNVGKSVRVTEDAHTRPIHKICQNEGSSFVSHPPSAYDLYVTSAAGDCIKMWDLRTNRCVQRYEGHLDRVHPCGVAISPCSRFIATGAEDRSAYIFDVRSGTYLHRLTGHTDVVTDVEFHPVYAQLITTTLDGKIRLFKEK